MDRLKASIQARNNEKKRCCKHITQALTRGLARAPNGAFEHSKNQKFKLKKRTRRVPEGFEIAK